MKKFLMLLTPFSLKHNQWEKVESDLRKKYDDVHDITVYRVDDLIVAAIQFTCARGMRNMKDASSGECSIINALMDYPDCGHFEVTVGDSSTDFF
jgi:hypothetical protein